MDVINLFKINKTYIKNQKGFTAVDVSIALILIMLFVSVIGMLIYNIYISSSASLRGAYALGYAIDIMEKIENTNYDELDQTLATTIVNDLNIPSSYKTSIQIQKYNELAGNESKLDLVKIINLDITYKVGNNEEVLDISRLKLK